MVLLKLLIGMTPQYTDLKQDNYLFIMTAKEKATELRSQFRDNAKYVCLEIIEELKREPYTNYERIIFWRAVKIELNKL